MDVVLQGSPEFEHGALFDKLSAILSGSKNIKE